MAINLTKQAQEIADSVALFAAIATEEIVSDWKEAADPDEREKLHAEMRGINRLKELIDGEANRKESDSEST